MNNNLVLICEDIRSLWNVGAIFRTADALGIDKIYLCGITGTPPRSEITKVALGADGWIPWEYRAASWELVKELKDRGYKTIALELTPQSINIDDFKPEFPLALILGNEVTGVTKSVLDIVHNSIQIPMVGRKESLNVAVAAGIALYQILNHK